MNPALNITLVQFLAGLVLLFWGKNLFWLFVSATGFIFGFETAYMVFGPQAGILVLLIALAAGIVTGVLAVFFQRVAVAVAGFSGGMYLVIWAHEFFRLDAGTFLLIYAFAGGVICAVLLSLIFDPVLVAITSMIAASLILDVMGFSKNLNYFLFPVLTLLGVVLQTALSRSVQEKS